MKPYLLSSWPHTTFCACMSVYVCVCACGGAIELPGVMGGVGLPGRGELG
uniref:Uncharacterized protein n=1 Tax=Gadus morhua TaxID=8049 RepID=A0A8C5C7G2_GADMO